jgi:dTDP-4-dehydrorhamnose reductase
MNTAPARKMFLLGQGKLGSALHAVFMERGWQITNPGRSDFDFSDFQALRVALDNAQPDVIVNAAAMAGIDQCESAADQAFHLNALLPRELARFAESKGALVVHFSTEAVFSGRKRDYYTEDDTPDPINIYGLSKLAGDHCVRENCGRYYILRLPILFGPSPKSGQFLEKMLAKARAGAGQLSIAADIITTPSFSCDVAEQVEQMVSDKAAFGLYHLANSGQASLYDLVREACLGLGLSTEVCAASHRDFPGVGRKNDFTPLRSAKIPALRPWQAALKEYLAMKEMI